MPSLNHGGKRVKLAALGGLLALGGLGAGIGATAASAATHHHGKAKHHRRAAGLLARADHASVEVEVKGQWVTYDLDRGTVGSVSAASITLDRPDGTDVTLSLSPSTVFKGIASEGAVVVGHEARVVSENGAALRVAQGTGAGRPAGTTTTTTTATTGATT